MSEPNDGLFQLFWQHPQDCTERLFVAQGDANEFESDKDREQWIRDMFTQALLTRPDGWVTMVCNSKSEYFLWKAS